MNDAESIVLDASKNIAIALLPIFAVVSFGLTAVLLTRETALKDLKHVNFARWLLVVIAVFLISLATLFGAFYFYGYVANADVSDSILALYIPGTLFVQGILQKVLLNFILKPNELPDNPENRNKKFGLMLGVTIPAVAFLYLRLFDIDYESKSVYFVMPVLVVLPFILIIVYANKINKP